MLLFKAKVLNVERPAVFGHCADNLLRKSIGGLHIDLQGNSYLCPVCCCEVGYDFFNKPLHVSTDTSGIQWYAHVEPLVFRLLNRRSRSWLRKNIDNVGFTVDWLERGNSHTTARALSLLCCSGSRLILFCLPFCFVSRELVLRLRPSLNRQIAPPFPHSDHTSNP